MCVSDYNLPTRVMNRAAIDDPLRIIKMLIIDQLYQVFQRVIAVKRKLPYNDLLPGMQKQ